MMDIKCNECDKFLFSIEDGKSLGYVGSVAQEKGFVYKNAFLYSEKYSSLFFCDHVCGKEFYNKHIPRNEEVTRKIDELKADIPRVSKECCEGLAKIQAMFKKKE